MIKIEVTGNSIPEVADKLLAIGASLRASAAIETPRGSTKAEAEGNAPQKTKAPKSAPVAEAIDSQPTTAEPSSTPVPVALASEELEVVDLPIAAINFETDIRPLALKVVEQRSKPVLELILTRFGVPRASLVPADRMSELHAALQEALSK
jgi:hypothetical protein